MIVFILWTVIAVTWISHVVVKQEKRLKKAELRITKLALRTEEQDLQIEQLFNRTACLERTKGGVI